ncbi:carboxypeptidase M32 [Chitinophaga nivalis]|uniref:Metal-dependent carboxypeptidase n=1 Tax=Chitinophaga nivalis TaxID=2991709 RepID=A0ABT3IT93_9BACT|nr:carboxypeptidase M32 [Chitinophaga nivalis]MCW3463370.1 carboxypeptidase M32 [Chitinophaga nivalis]MCW3486940.1 carboxypeptidase M32 [Chitinophaga nivalis]
MSENKATIASYNDYQTKLQKIADVRNTLAVLSWDQETYLPEKGAAFRGQQITTLSTIAHEMYIAPELEQLLQTLHGAEGLDAIQTKNIALSKEDYDKNKKYPAAFVAEMSQVTNESYHAWIKARKANDYSLFAPSLTKMIALKKQETDILGYEGHPYNALLNEYEKGADVIQLDKVFNDVKTALSPLLAQIEQKAPVQKDFLHLHYQRDRQWQFGIDLLKEMGYDLTAGRQDISEHPFTTSFNPQDVRVTTRIDENDFGNMTWSCIHEGGHALYEQGLPTAQYGLPCGEATSLGIHESQSRLWENNVGRSLGFWQHQYPRLQRLFPENLSAVPLSGFYHAINKVQPSLIRTEADELTYHFHIMIRYEIEKGLMDGSIAVKDLHHTWNEYYRQYLHVTVPDDVHGVLQDIHWSHGSFGYFPTYSLGSFYAAQFFAAAQQQITGLDTAIAAGDYSSLLQWLRQHIHPFGRYYTSNELCAKVTGKPLEFGYFLDYAKKKYSDIYGL